jgi:arsenite methyltransferase
MTTDAPTENRDRRGKYGFDGNVVGAAGMAATGVSVLGFAVDLLARGEHPTLAKVGLLGATALLLTIGVYLHTTRRGKFAVWAELLESLHLSGGEHVLDVGCGRGAVLTMVAKRLPRGRGVGIDLWRTADQSGNGPDATLGNLFTEGVRERCELVTGDMQSMPFPDASFDIVVSSIAIHNIRRRSGRRNAIDEIARVLKPGGRLMLADLAWTGSYAAQLRERGFDHVHRRGLGWRFWWGPGYPTTAVVTASKRRDDQ